MPINKTPLNNKTKKTSSEKTTITFIYNVNNGQKASVKFENAKV